MLFSIITICYNNEKEIRTTIESVLKQNYPDVEYIIKDGKSVDQTVSIAEEYRPLFEKKGYSYRIISEKDNGIYDAMNKGIQAATGELIGLINAGDWYEEDALQKVAQTYAGQPFDLYYADIHIVKEDGSVLVKHSKLDRFPVSRHWNHPSTFIRRQIYEELGLYRGEGIHDDFDLILRIRKAGKRVVVKNDMIANFAIGGTSNQKSFSMARRRIHDRYQCYKNNGYSPLYWFDGVVMEIAKYLLQ